MSNTRRTGFLVEGRERTLAIAPQTSHADRATHGAAGVSVPQGVAAVLVVVLVVQNHFTEHKKILGRSTAFWRRRLEKIKIVSTLDRK